MDTSSPRLVRRQISFQSPIKPSNTKFDMETVDNTQSTPPKASRQKFAVLKESQKHNLEMEIPSSERSEKEMSFAPCKRKARTSENEEEKQGMPSINNFDENFLFQSPPKSLGTPKWSSSSDIDVISGPKLSKKQAEDSPFCKLLDQSDYQPIEMYQALPQKEVGDAKKQITETVLISA